MKCRVGANTFTPSYNCWGGEEEEGSMPTIVEKKFAYVPLQFSH